MEEFNIRDKHQPTILVDRFREFLVEFAARTTVVISEACNAEIQKVSQKYTEDVVKARIHLDDDTTYYNRYAKREIILREGAVATESPGAVQEFGDIGQSAKEREKEKEEL